MANTVLHKHSATTGIVPAAGSLTARELALNTADGRLFTKTDAGVIIEFARKESVSAQNNISGSSLSSTFQSGIVAGTTCLTVFQNTPVGSISSKECNNWADAPNTGWWIIQSMRHTNSTNIWGTQIAYGWENNANTIYQRNVSAGVWSPWVRVDINAHIIDATKHVTADQNTFLDAFVTGGSFVTFDANATF